jgi:electron transfer flavoprotein beta subunit
MKVLVPIKRVIDYNVHVRLNAAGTAVETDNVKMSLNPFDETAVEEAIRLRERGSVQEIVVVSVGPQSAIEVIRTALAMGADSGRLIETDGAIEPPAVAKILKAVCAEEKPDLVICGRQAIDDDAAQTGPMLASLMGWAQAVGASKIELAAGTALVRCEIDGGTKTVRLPLPAVITADLRLNEPRYVSLPGIMKAKRKPVTTKAAADFGIDLEPRVEQVSLCETPPRKPGIKTTDAAEFLDRLIAAGGEP